jgi:hypothetical protein
MSLYRIMDPPGPDWATRKSWRVERPLSEGNFARFIFNGTREEVLEEVARLNDIIWAEAE